MSRDPSRQRPWYRRVTQPTDESPAGRLKQRAKSSLGRWTRATRLREGSSPVAVIPHRTSGNDAAVVFIHGFGSSGTPFGRFPEVLAEDPALGGWDLLALGYSTSLMPDIRSFWESDPSIRQLATYLRTTVQLEPLDSYEALALVTHSMGGLVVQEALLDDPALADRVSHVFMFGTPSNGVRFARWGSFLKRQIEDMAEGGPFIGELRRRWDQRYGERRPFDLWAVAGDRDMFVPPSSALTPFPKETQLVVPGDHLELVDVRERGSMTAQVVSEGLLGAAAPAGPWNAARVAVESSEHDRAIRELGDKPGELDQRHLIDLALALDATGRRDDATAILTEHAGGHGPGAKGTLADLIKRKWLDDGRRRDADSALQLYSEALAEAEEAGDHEDAYYHAINVAFLELAYRRDHEAAGRAARQALDACGRSTTSYWRLATEGEAHLHLDQPEKAIETYRAAVALEPTTRELEATYVQAAQLIESLGRRDLRDDLDSAFRGRPQPSARAGR